MRKQSIAREMLNPVSYDNGKNKCPLTLYKPEMLKCTIFVNFEYLCIYFYFKFSIGCNYKTLNSGEKEITPIFMLSAIQMDS